MKTYQQPNDIFILFSTNERFSSPINTLNNSLSDLLFGITILDKYI